MANRDGKSPEACTEYVLDISGEVCPLTFVRTKLLLERMVVGETATVLLRGSEPLTNVPRAVVDQGHEVLELTPLPATGVSNGVYRLRIRKEAAKPRRFSGDIDPVAQ